MNYGFLGFVTDSRRAHHVISWRFWHAERAKEPRDYVAAFKFRSVSEEFITRPFTLIAKINVAGATLDSLMYYTYILQSLKNKELYVGYTEDLRKRLDAHNSGKNVSTNPNKPYKLVFYEAFLCEEDAKSREKYLKSGWGRRGIKKLLTAYFGGVA